MIDPKEIKKAINTQIGAKIKEVRQITGFTQKELGAILDVTYQQIQKYENGRSIISAPTLFQIAEFLDLPVSIFFEEKNKKIPEIISKDLQQWLDLYENITPEEKKEFYNSFLKKKL